MSFVKHKLRGASSVSGGKTEVNSLYGIEGGANADGKNLSRADGKSSFEKESAPGAVNMIRYSDGQVAKRGGFRYVNKAYDVVTVKAVYKYVSPNGSEKLYIFTENNIILTTSNGDVLKKYELTGNMNDCKGFQAGKYMFFLESGKLKILDGESDYIVEYFYKSTSSVMKPDDAYLPTTFIASDPSGDGFSYQSANILNPFVAEQYIGDGKSKEYKVHFPIKSVYKAYILGQDGQWQETEVMSNTEGSVTFVNPPPVPDIAGEDNVRIVYHRPYETLNYMRISSSRCGCAFGASGFEDRVFVSGNDYYPGCVYYSDINNPTYFPETNYIKVGSDNTRVCALATNGTTLYVICNDNIYCVTGKSTEDKQTTDYVEDVQFYITDILKTPEAVKCQTVVFDGEINYLTKSGVCAVTPSGVMDERCSQVRSAFIESYLVNIFEDNYKMLRFGSFLVISDRKDTLYVLDGNRFSLSQDRPFAGRQYEAYILKGIPAKHIWTVGDKLYFSDEKEIYRFEKDFLSDGVYADEIEKSGKLRPVKAYWETPCITPGGFADNKFFMKTAVHLGSSEGEDKRVRDTDVKISARFDSGKWHTVKDYDGKRSVFRYGSMNYGCVSFRPYPQRFGFYVRNLRKKAGSVKLRFENENENQPFILKGYNIEYLKM